MNEKDILLSHTLDLKEKCADNSIITNTNFLSIDEISIVKTTDKTFLNFCDVFYYGGYETAERCVAVFTPKFLELESIEDYFNETPDENPLCLIKITKDKFCTLSHRDYLGSLMGLGIKREMIGDIVVSDDGCCVFALKSISRYICENLERIGRGSVECHILNVSDFISSEQNIKEEFFFVSSLRLDVFLSSVFNLSRTQSAEYLKKGVVFVNSAECVKKDFMLKQGDKIVLRGKGKVVFKEVVGESKKGRLRISVIKYV